MIIAGGVAGPGSITVTNAHRPTADTEPLPTNPEATFGHVGGFTKIVKPIASVSILADRRAGMHTVTLRPRRIATPAPGGDAVINSPHAPITSADVVYLGGHY